MKPKNDKELRNNLENRIIEFCRQNNFNYRKDYSDSNKVKIEIEDDLEINTFISIYNTGTIQVQGPDNYITDRFKKLKETIKNEKFQMKQKEVEMKQEETVEVKEEIKEDQKIQVDPQTAFQLQVLEFDKKIAAAELEVAKLKFEKNDFIYSQNVQIVVALHKEKEMKKQIEEETMKKLTEENKA